MRLSSRAKYALRMMTELAKSASDSEPVSLGAVAERTRISRRYLDQVVVGLKHAALVESITGRSGGYRLSMPAEEIPLGRIVEAAIGPINIVECVRRPETCIRSDSCECRWLYRKINKRITEALNEVALSDLLEKSTILKAFEGIPTKPYACPERTERNGAAES